MAAELDMDTMIYDRINELAPTISSQPLGLAYHRPESWALASRCFENATRKAAEAGGLCRFGWTFHHRYADTVPGVGYLFVTHHAVWHAPIGHLIDVTSYPDPRHRPIPSGESVLFLIDDRAQPVKRLNLVAPLPLRFFALDRSVALSDYVKKLNEQELQACNNIYAGKPE